MAKSKSTGMIAAAMAITLQACAPVNQGSAESALAEGRLDDAAYDVQAALAHDPDSLTLKNLAAQIFTQRGANEYQGGQMIAASEDFHRAINYYPTYAAAYDYLGMIAFQQNDWEAAIKYGSLGVGYEGKPEPGYVESARQNLRKVQAGGLAPSRRTGNQASN
ncbi:MAG TPA: hypothetical protein VJX23_12870 [Candidatus Binataceae bacterium]|nr:hypothetical protein [Candidatus Binataceae bacterium]